MSKALIKYNSVRNELRNGDVALFRGDSILSKSIQYCDNAYYNHSGLVIKLGSRLMVLDSNGDGVHPDFLSIRMDEYVDFCIVRISNGFSQTEIDSCVNRVIDRAESHQIKYEYSLLPKIALARKVGMKMKFRDKENRDIYSMFTGDRYLSQSAGIKCMQRAKSEQGWITPQDQLRYLDKNELSSHFDDSGKK
jgi:hypothetical protein